MPLTWCTNTKEASLAFQEQFLLKLQVWECSESVVVKSSRPLRQQLLSRVTVKYEIKVMMRISVYAFILVLQVSPLWVI